MGRCRGQRAHPRLWPHCRKSSRSSSRSFSASACIASRSARHSCAAPSRWRTSAASPASAPTRRARSPRAVCGSPTSFRPTGVDEARLLELAAIASRRARHDPLDSAILQRGRGCAAWLRPSRCCERVPFTRGHAARNGDRAGEQPTRRRRVRGQQGLGGGDSRHGVAGQRGAGALDRPRQRTGERRAQGHRLRLAAARPRAVGRVASRSTATSFAGLLCFEDPVREGVADAIAALPGGRHPYDHGDRRPSPHRARRCRRDRAGRQRAAGDRAPPRWSSAWQRAGTMPSIRCT